MAEQQNAKQQNAKEPDLNQLLKVRREKLAELQAAGKDPFQITKYDVTAHSEDVKADYAEWEGKEVSIAGRMMSKRVMGKASFCNVQDLKGNIQCYVARDDLGEEAYKDFKRMDIGDIVGKVSSSPPRWVRSQFMQPPWCCSPRACRSFRRSITV